MPDQADNLRELVREALVTAGAAEPVGTCLAVVGSTSGTGATATLIATAQELASLGQRVLAIDANLVRPALGRQLGLNAAASLADVLAGRRRLCEATAPAGFGAALLGVPAPASGIEADSRQRFATELRAARQRYDAVLIDAGSGLSPWAEWLCRRAAGVLLVASTAHDDVRGAYAVIKSLGGQVATRLVMNKSADGRAASAMAQRIGDTALQFLGCNPLTQAPAVLPPRETPEDGEYRRAIRLLAAELLTPRRVSHRRGAAMPAAVPSAALASTLDTAW
ncbi:MAG: hypothetical protein CMJ58_24225 [Planctomycetaceae bacterium]|nr:hypothetical protein [Planctomycetaceae bacterium]